MGWDGSSQDFDPSPTSRQMRGTFDSYQERTCGCDSPGWMGPNTPREMKYVSSFPTISSSEQLPIPTSCARDFMGLMANGLYYLVEYLKLQLLITGHRCEYLAI